jgi:CRP-like cAMP-binding protein
LHADDIRAVQALPCSRRTLERETYLVREGACPQECALLLSGFAYRHKLAGDGARQILSIQIAGEFIDLQNSLLGYADHSVQALTRAEVAVIPKAALLDLAVSNPAVGRAMWLDTLIDASIFREWVVNVAQRDARARIAHLICEMATRLEAQGIGGRGTYPFPLTQEQLADATGLTAVHTNRVLQSLRKEGLISLVSQSLTILDAEQLRALGDFSDRYLHHAAA